MRHANVFMEQIAKSHSRMTARATEQKFSMEKVAELIRVHVSTVSRLMDSGKLGYYQIGRRRIVGASHLEQYLLLAERQAKIRSTG
jgi:excisionase family DNA binding protein